MGLKSHIFWLIVSLSFWWSTVLLTSSEQEWRKWLIFYDSKTHQPIPVINPPDNTTSRVQMLRMGPIPCSCQDFTCGCCAFMDIEYFDYHRNGCMNMTYYPNDFALGANMLWNEMSVWSQNISGKNPPPACVQMPIPYLPAMDMCVRMYNIYTPGQNIHMCMNWEFRTERAPLLILEFDCFRWGSDGFANVKPDAPNAGIPTEGPTEGMGGAMGGEAPQGEEEIAEASEGDENDVQKNKTKATTPKSPQKATLRPSTAAPFLNLEIEEIISPTLNSVATKNNTDKMKPKENLENKAPNFNLNLTEFEDHDTRVSLLNAPEKVVKININIDNFLNGTVTAKGRGYPVSKERPVPANPATDMPIGYMIAEEFPVPVNPTIDMPRGYMISKELSVSVNPATDKPMGYLVSKELPFPVNPASDNPRGHPVSVGRKRQKRETEDDDDDERAGKGTASKKKKKPNTRRRNRLRNRNKNKNKDTREKLKLYAPTLSFNIVEMPLSEYKSQKRMPAVTIPTYKDFQSSLKKPDANTKEVVLSYPEPTGARSMGHGGGRHRNQKSVRKLQNLRNKKSIKTVDAGNRAMKSVRVLSETTPAWKPMPGGPEVQFRDAVLAESAARAKKSLQTEEPEVSEKTSIRLETPVSKFRSSVRVDPEFHTKQSASTRTRSLDREVRSKTSVQDRPKTRVRRSVQAEPEVQTKKLVQAELEVQTKKMNQVVPEFQTKKLNQVVPEVQTIKLNQVVPEVQTKKLIQAESEVQTKKLIHAEPEGRAKKKKPGNRKTTTENPTYHAPALNFNVFEVEESFNDRFKLDPKLTSVTPPGTRTPMMTSTTSRPGPDIDININNLYIYLASFTTFRRNETLQDY